MQMSKLLSACMIALLLGGWGITSRALANENTAVEDEAVESEEGEELIIVAQALGAGRNRADIFRLTCATGCTCARATLTDPAEVPPNPNRFVATLVGDFDAGDGTIVAGVSSVITPLPNGVSGTAQVCQGPGQYAVSVYKNTALAEAYSANLRCVNAGGAVCGHAVVLIQNQ